ncbi:MogA/MoaB family molybdenum cofactor biosynthesis protein [Staphylococcus sp. SQ8-PEA]|uniref:Molybdenum cofactor biosynthesis protein B n=1 Tax=Staphylococcus marylandisciuri TaxID=2981529 RepID=A0ABT2QMJ3_9STAP|nr:MogA/MoaB family molybdenum cofactor biosynthesis protein [Staphylococcus marylandisciuri]MCU5745182.1 MogA/MoaB family molybdenum cofactor biosynthesis protein [Staphylococcus marylandisciuri]
MSHAHEKLNRTIECAVLTVSDTRDYETDKGGKHILDLLATSDVRVRKKHYQIVKDDEVAIRTQVQQWEDTDIDVIITTGGTGIAKKDVTIEAIKPLLFKEIEGFGELFRYLSYEEDIGSKAMLSRAVAGTIGKSGQQIVFCLPGSTGAVRLAMEKLIKPELNHLISEVVKDNK